MTALGLTSAEARERPRPASPPRPPPRGSRSYREIVRSNTFTVFNLILGTLLVLVLVFGDPRDALFGGVIVANTAIGIFQEVRAKRTLDRLSLLAAPKARAWPRRRDRRAGPLTRSSWGRRGPTSSPATRSSPTGAWSPPGGCPSTSRSSPARVTRSPRPRATRSCPAPTASAGAGDYEVESVGADSFAERIASEARGTRSVLSPLQRDINTVLKITVAAMVPLAIALVIVLAIQDRGVT